MSSKTNDQPTTTPAAETPPAPTAKDVANAISKVVDVIGHLPPQLQLRALGGAATALGLDKEQRAASRGNAQQQQRTNNNQQRGATR